MVTYLIFFSMFLVVLTLFFPRRRFPRSGNIRFLRPTFYRNDLELQADVKFHQCIGEFIKLWESQLEIDWKSGITFYRMSEEGPHLSLLPEEFLPSLDKHLCQLKLRIEKVNYYRTQQGKLLILNFVQEINEEDVANVTETVKALVILCRNLDNIPFIASCRLVTSCVAIAAALLSRLVEDDRFKEVGMFCVVTVCLFLEALYDPYFCWRKYLANDKADSSKIQYQPALLHPEVIPFIYGNLFIVIIINLALIHLFFCVSDCFNHYNIDSIAQTVQSLLYLLGAIIKGAQVSSQLIAINIVILTLFYLFQRSA